MKLQKQVDDYSQKLIENFKLIIVNPSPNLTDQERNGSTTSSGYSYQDRRIETNTKRVMTHVLKRWNENKYIANPSTCTLSPAETVSLRMYSIELKYCSCSLVMYYTNQRHSITQSYALCFCWNFTVTFLLLTYSCQISNAVVSISFIYQYIYIIYNMFLLTFIYFVYIFHMALTNKEIFEGMS